jgi:nucleotide-binding universal stress UspA family protein
MKKILVPTDFSACAEYAMETGLMFAEKFDAQLYFLHIIKEDLSRKKSSTYQSELEQKIANADQLFSKWYTKAKEISVNLISGIKTGKFIDILSHVVDEVNPDFIIMGSHGASGKKEYFIGSNTQKAVRAIHRPFFIVKEKLEKLHFEKVVFASRFNEADKGPFQYFLRFMEPFNPEIHLVTINTYSWFSQPYVILKEVMKDFESLATGFKCRSHFFSDLSVDAGIRHFSIQMGADLVVVSNLERSPIKRTLSGSNVEALVNHSKLPVLSVDYPS